MGLFPVDEVVAWRCFTKKASLLISKNSQENAFVGVFFLLKLQA